MRWVAASVFACCVVASCAPPPLGHVPPTLELVVANPRGLSFDVVQASGDDDVAIVSDQSTGLWRQELRAGLYQVIVHDHGRRIGLPAPLLRGLVPEGRLTITIPAIQTQDGAWAWIPGGISLMGDTLGVGQEDERPAHLVELPEFWIGRNEVNAYGLHGYGVADLTGNAFEWVADVYDPAAYAGRDATITPSPLVRQVTNTTEPPYHVLRGGSFVLDGMYLRNRFRMRQRPSVRTDHFGFRVVRESAPDTEGTASCESRPG